MCHALVTESRSAGSVPALVKRGSTREAGDLVVLETGGDGDVHGLTLCAPVRELAEATVTARCRVQQMARDGAVRGALPAGLPPARDASVGGVSWMLDLQRQVGNAAVTRLVTAQSKVAKPARPLTSPILSGHDGLQEAASSAAKAVGMGERGDRVQALQHALAELGFTLARTMTRGTADGVYGKETYKAVRAFQQSTDTVRPVGGHEAGPKTLKALDVRLAGRHGTTPAPEQEEVPVGDVGDKASVNDDPPRPGPAPTIPTGLTIQPAAPGKLDPTGLPDKHPQSVAKSSGTTEHGGAGDGFERFEAVAKLGWSGPFTFERGSESRFPWPKACDEGQFEVTGKLNLKGIPLDGRGRFTLFPELSLDVGITDALCGQVPGLMANLTWWKFQAWKALEISMNSGLGLKAPPFGWITKPAALEATMHLGNGFSFGASLEIEHSGEIDHHGRADHSTGGKAGTFIEYRF